MSLDGSLAIYIPSFKLSSCRLKLGIERCKGNSKASPASKWISSCQVGCRHDFSLIRLSSCIVFVYRILCFWMATDSARATVPLECHLLQASRPAVRTGNFSGGMRLQAGKPCLVDRFHQLRTTPVVCFQTQATSNSNTSRSCEE